MQSGDHEDIKFPSCNNLVYKVVLSVQKWYNFTGLKLAMM
jgi:hypothetical protein